MTERRSRRRLTVAVVAVVVAVAVGYCGFGLVETWRSHAEAAEARERVRVGMPLPDAEQALAGAWYHVACAPAQGVAQHLFLFGTRDVERAGVVYLRTDQRSGAEVVTLVGSEENNRLFLYQHCTDLDISAAKGKWWR